MEIKGKPHFAKKMSEKNTESLSAIESQGKKEVPLRRNQIESNSDAATNNKGLTQIKNNCDKFCICVTNHKVSANLIEQQASRDQSQKITNLHSPARNKLTTTAPLALEEFTCFRCKQRLECSFLPLLFSACCPLERSNVSFSAASPADADVTICLSPLPSYETDARVP